MCVRIHVSRAKHANVYLAHMTTVATYKDNSTAYTTIAIKTPTDTHTHAHTTHTDTHTHTCAHTRAHMHTYSGQHSEGAEANGSVGAAECQGHNNTHNDYAPNASATNSTPANTKAHPTTTTIKSVSLSLLVPPVSNLSLSCAPTQLPWHYHSV